MWDVEGTDEFAIFYSALTDAQRYRVDAAVDQLVEHGPNLGRPLADRIHGSRIHHLKELRPTSSQRSAIRIMFAFDPARTAILLLGGDKANEAEWNNWYTLAIPQAEALYDIYLDETNQKD